MRRHLPVFTLALALLCGSSRSVDAQSGNLTTRVDGSFAGGTFDGAVTLQRFEAQGDRLVAVGTLDGTLTDAAGEEVGTLRDQPLRLAVGAGSLAATCDLLTARLGPTTVEGSGQRVELAAVELEISARAARGDRLRNLLCGLHDKLAGGASAGALAAELDRVLGALG
jgi:hypothetical protein